MDKDFELSKRERFNHLLFRKEQLSKSNEYYHKIHPIEAAAVDKNLADAAAAAEAKKKAAAEAAAKAAAAKAAAPAQNPAAPGPPDGRARPEARSTSALGETPPETTRP